MNEEYCINEKKAVRMVGGFTIKLKDYKNRIDKIITLLSSDKDSSREGVNMLKELFSETKILLGR